MRGLRASASPTGSTGQPGRGGYATPSVVARSIVARLHEAFNARRFGDLDEVLDDHVLMVLAGMSLRGITAVRDYLAGGRARSR